MSVEDSQNKQKWVSIDRFAQTNASKSFMKSQAKNDLEVRIIMEYCDRGSLVAAIRGGWFRNPEDPARPDLDAIIHTALDIARGLCLLHENNIIHGDLKPHNVLLQNRPFVDSRGFIAKIADFGLSIKMESEQSHVDGMRMVYRLLIHLRDSVCCVGDRRVCITRGSSSWEDFACIRYLFVWNSIVGNVYGGTHPGRHQRRSQSQLQAYNGLMETRLQR